MVGGVQQRRDLGGGRGVLVAAQRGMQTQTREKEMTEGDDKARAGLIRWRQGQRWAYGNTSIAGAPVYVAGTREA